MDDICLQIINFEDLSSQPPPQPAIPPPSQTNNRLATRCMFQFYSFYFDSPRCTRVQIFARDFTRVLVKSTAVWISKFDSMSGYFTKVPLHSIVNKYSKSKNDQRKNTHVRFLEKILKINEYYRIFFSSRNCCAACFSIKIDSKNPDCTYCVAETTTISPA